MLTVLGYYGFDNLGDELLLATFAQCLPPDAGPLHILTQSPDKTQAAYRVAYPKASCYHRMRPLAVIKALRQSRWLVLGGGGLFQDTTSLNSVVYYTGMVLLARLLGNRVLWWAQGIGPLNHPFSRWLTGLALRVSSTVSVRDDDSLRWVKQLAPGKPVSVVADPVWLFTPPPLAPPSTGLIGVSLRAWPDLTPAGINRLAQVVEATFPVDVPVVLLPFQHDQDVPVLTAFSQALNPNRRVEWAKGQDILTIYPRLTGLIGMRFHAVLLAALHGIPVMAIPYAPKLAQLAAQLQIPGVSPDHLSQLTKLALTPANNEALQRQIALAQHNQDMLEQLI